ncbi:MAG: hypothetical protein WC792_02680 [Candidatus Micrarchaeia archaeon]
MAGSALGKFSFLFSVLFSILLFSSLAFAASDCVQACAADRDKWIKIGADKAASDSYYCGLTESNCWSRSSTPPGQPDPCWKMCTDPECSPWSKCDAQFQACCAESARLNEESSYIKCVANCPPEDSNLTAPALSATETPLPSVPAEQATPNVSGEQPSPTPSLGEVYEKSTFKVDFADGDVTITTRDGKVVSPQYGEEIGPDATITVGKSGNGFVRIKVMRQDSIFPVYVTVNAGTTFKFSLNTKGFSKALASSEHASVRGTINGGGDFIKGAGKSGRRAVSFAGAEKISFAELPTGSISVGQNSTRDYPFVVAAALPAGTVYVTALDDVADYDVSLDGAGNVQVFSRAGRVAVFNGDFAMIAQSRRPLTVYSSAVAECETGCEKTTLENVLQSIPAFRQPLLPQPAQELPDDSFLWLALAALLALIVGVFLLRKFLWVIIVVGILLAGLVLFLLFVR